VLICLTCLLVVALRRPVRKDQIKALAPTTMLTSVPLLRPEPFTPEPFTGASIVYPISRQSGEIEEESELDLEAGGAGNP